MDAHVHTVILRLFGAPPPLDPVPSQMIDIMEVVYRGARKGRGLVVSPKDYSTKYKY